MLKKTSKSKLKVRYAETDQMGVVYHGNYAQYFEVARIEWLDKIGISYKKMEENGIMLPVVSLSTKFIKSALFDDVLTITTRIKKMPTAKIEFEYDIHNHNGELLTQGETVLVFISMESKRPVKCPNNVIELIKNYKGIEVSI